jgi:hypothetical protein
MRLTSWPSLSRSVRRVRSTRSCASSRAEMNSQPTAQAHSTYRAAKKHIIGSLPDSVPQVRSGKTSPTFTLAITENSRPRRHPSR